MSAHHITPMKTYNVVFGTLIILTAFTVLVAQFDFGAFNTLIAMAVATVKATLVGAYFMQLRNEDKTFTLCLISGVFFLIVMFSFIAMDVGSRVIESSTL